MNILGINAYHGDVGGDGVSPSWGAHALGNRSIPADPRRADMREIINTRIKLRARFPPFAPTVREEALDTSFNENEPIVLTPAHALDCFLRTSVDVLVIGGHVLERARVPSSGGQTPPMEI